MIYMNFVFSESLSNLVKTASAFLDYKNYNKKSESFGI